MVIKGISLTVVACNHCVFYNKLHFRTFLPRRKVHGQKDYSKAGSGIPISKTMGNGVELPFLGNYSLRTLIFQIAMYQRSVWTREKMIKYRVQSKNDYGPTKIKAEWTSLNLKKFRKENLGECKLRTEKAAPKSLFFLCVFELSLSHGKVLSIWGWEKEEKSYLMSDNCAPDLC